MKRVRLAVAVLALALGAGVLGARAVAIETNYCSDDVPPAADTVIMLATSWCPYCAKARKFLQARGVDYCEYDIEQSPVGEALHDRSGQRGIPVILIDGRVIGGYDPDELSLALKKRAERRTKQSPEQI